MGLNKKRKIRAKTAMLIGVLLGVVCPHAPPQYQIMCSLAASGCGLVSDGIPPFQ